MKFLTNTDFDFIGRRKTAFLISIGLIIIGLVSLAVHKGPNFSIDFVGGILLELHFELAVPTEEIRAALREVKLGDRVVDLSRSEIQEFGSANDILIRVERMSTEVAVADVIKERLKSAFPNRIPKDERQWLRRQESVGPKIGGELKQSAIYAILVALLGMLIYIGWRFKFRFAVAAIVALFHDVLITLGVLSLLNQEISLAVVAALLTIVGYSLNDTIVVFDRIRENLRALRKERNYGVIVNRSINDSLSRTVITSLTSFIVVLVLFLRGGEVIHGFALTLMIGVLVGTYSSIFVASPVLVEWQKRAEAKRLARGRRI